MTILRLSLVAREANRSSKRTNTEAVMHSEETNDLTTEGSRDIRRSIFVESVQMVSFVMDK